MVLQMAGKVNVKCDYYVRDTNEAITSKTDTTIRYAVGSGLWYLGVLLEFEHLDDKCHDTEDCGEASESEDDACKHGVHDIFLCIWCCSVFLL